MAVVVIRWLLTLACLGWVWSGSRVALLATLVGLFIFVEVTGNQIAALTAHNTLMREHIRHLKEIMDEHAKWRKETK